MPLTSLEHHQRFDVVGERDTWVLVRFHSYHCRANISDPNGLPPTNSVLDSLFMDDENPLHQLIANKLNKNIPQDFVDKMREQLNQLDDNSKAMVLASRHLAELAIENDEPMLHYAATVVLWITGLLNNDNVIDHSDVIEYASYTWSVVQGAIQEVVEDGIQTL
jgi:hypothetical protein